MALCYHRLMGQLLIRQIDDATIKRLEIVASQRNTSVEVLARDAIMQAATLSPEEKRAIVQRLHAWSEAAKVPGVPQTPGVDLIREDRDR